MNENGTPVNAEDGPNWPLWKTDNSSKLSSSRYIHKVEDRNTNSYPLGPAYFSDEDIYCSYKDTDLSYFEGGSDFRKNLGYPLGLQFEQLILSWDDEEKKDMIVVYYKAINTSQDTLFDCWFAPVYDMDLAVAPKTMAGAANDFVRYYDEDESLNMAVAWSDTTVPGEKDLGYLACSFVLSPAVDENGYLINGNGISENLENQLGLTGFRRWPIQEDLQDDEARYKFLSSGIIDKYAGEPGDYRLLFSTGPFHMLPGDTAQVGVQINFAMPALGGEATGETEDLTDLVEKVEEGQEYFSNILTNVREYESYREGSLSVFPNPASERIYVDYVLNSDAETSVELYNLSGEMVGKAPNIPASAGRHRIQLDLTDFDGNSLPPGVYYCVLKSGVKRESAKLIVY